MARAPKITLFAGLFLLSPAWAGTVVKKADGGWVVENEFISARLDASTGTVELLDKRTGWRWWLGPRRRAEVAVPKGRRPSRSIRITSRMVADAKDVKDDADLSAKVWAWWDEKCLRLRVEVRDDKLDLYSKPNRKWWERDSVEFWVGRLQIGVSLSPEEAKACTVRRWLDSVRASFGPQRGGYFVEVSVPWSVAGLRPRAGLRFPFAVGVNDADGRGRREGQIYFPTTWVHSQPETFALAVLADESGRAPRAREGGGPVRRVEPLTNGLRFAMALPSERGPVEARVVLTVPPSEPEARLEVDLPDRNKNPGKIWWPPALVPPKGDVWLAFAPYGNGLLVPASEPPIQWLPCFGTLDMPWVGVLDVKSGAGCMVLVETPDDAVVRLAPAQVGGKRLLLPALLWLPSMQKFRYPRRLTYRFFDRGGYVAMCKHFRKVAREWGVLKTLAEKARENPNVKRLLGAPDIWGAKGLSFCKLAYRAGMRRALVNGRFPPDEMREINRLGFLTSEYDNYVDIPRGGMKVERGLLARLKEALESGDLSSLPDKVREALLEARMRPDGTPWRGWVTFDKTRFWLKRCSRKMPEAAAKFIPPILKQYPYLARFLDVTTAESLMECYSKEHPVTRTEDREWRRRLIAYVKSLGLVVGGEHGRWWSADLLDYQEGMMSLNYFFTWPAGHLRAPESREGVGERYLKYGIGHFYRVPLWELCFHDCVVSTWYWGDSTGWLYRVAPEISDKKDAFNVLYGTVPLMWAREPTKERGGYGFTKNRERFLRSYRATARLHMAVGMQEMVSHEFLTEDRAVQKTVFADGTECIVNFGERPYEVRRRGRVYRIPQNGFYVEGPKIRQFLAEVEGRRVLFIEAPGYAYLDAGGKFYDAWYLATEGSAEAEARSKERIWLTLTRPPKSVVIRPQRIVKGWDLEGTRVFVLDGDFGRAWEASWRRAEGGIEIRPRPEDVVDGAAVYEIVTGSLTAMPDLAVSGLHISRRRPRQGEKVNVKLTVENRGRKAARAEVAVLLDREGGPSLGRLQLSLRPGERRALSLTLDTEKLDGPHTLVAVADPEGRVAEVSEANNTARLEFEVIPEPRFWRVAVPVEVRAGDVERLDEPVFINLDLATLAAEAGAGRLRPETLRAVEVDEAGRPVRWLPAQFEPGKKRAVVVLSGRTPKGAKRRLLLLLDDRKGAHLPPGPRIWDEKRNCADTPFYKAVLREGVVTALHIKVGKEPERSILWAIMFSSGQTGWTKEHGEVEKFEVLTNGPARAVVFVRKRLKGDVVYEKTYEFYPRHFVVSTKVNRNPGAIFCRLYLSRPCTFEDSGGAKAKVDGSGEAEGVYGKTKRPRWFALYSPSWALSCVALVPFDHIGYQDISCVAALVPFDHIGYWDIGSAWGGVGFFTPKNEGVMAFVVHPGKEDARFAALDAKRLLSPPEVVLGKPQ